MRVITEKRLREYRRIAVQKNIKSVDDLLDELINACEELNQWRPIESAPKDRSILLFYPEHKAPGGRLEPYIAAMKYNELATIMYQPTMWQELPELPGSPK